MRGHVLTSHLSCEGVNWNNQELAISFVLKRNHFFFCRSLKSVDWKEVHSSRSCLSLLSLLIRRGWTEIIKEVINYQQIRHSSQGSVDWNQRDISNHLIVFVASYMRGVDWNRAWMTTNEGKKFIKKKWFLFRGLKRFIQCLQLVVSHKRDVDWNESLLYDDNSFVIYFQDVVYFN